MTDTPKIAQAESRKSIHIVGICGVATSALAIAFHKKGYFVTGSDKGFYPPVSTALEDVHIPFYAGWHPEKITELHHTSPKSLPDFIVAGGSGTSLSNPEIIFAKEHGVKILSFAQALGEFFIKKNSIVTVGTWGKTTTSAILSYIFLQANINPSYFTGGLSLSHDTGALSDSDWSIVEGDEYQAAIWDRQPKFAYYAPTHLLLTSVSWDHADLYPTEKAYFDTFEKLVAKIPHTGVIVYCTDNAGAVTTVAKARPLCPTVTYGKKAATEPQPNYYYHNISHTKQGISFSITHNNETFELYSPMLGIYNADNITGCFAMAHQAGITPDVIINAIAGFKGIKRRLERRYEGPVTVLDCHAPTPEKASSILESIRDVYHDKIISIFEPNIGGRQRNSIAQYDDAFKNTDYLYLPRFTKTKIDPNETDRPLEAPELAVYISKRHTHVIYNEDDSALIDTAIAQAKEGDVIAFLGSHGFRGMIEDTIMKLGAKYKK